MNHAFHKHQKEKSKGISFASLLGGACFGVTLFTVAKYNFRNEVGVSELGPSIDPKIFAKLEAACEARDAETIKKIIPSDIEDFIVRGYLKSNNCRVADTSKSKRFISFENGIDTVKQQLGRQGHGISLNPVIVGCTTDYVRQFHKSYSIQRETAEIFSNAGDTYRALVENYFEK